MSFGTACRIDVRGLFVAWRRMVERRGRVLLRSPARRLLRDAAGAVVGATAGAEDLETPAVLLATGGFQGDRALRRELLGPRAEAMLVRSNPGSVGDGLRLGCKAGGAIAAAGRDGFYGHLVPSPLAALREEDFLPLTQYWSNHAILVDRRGRRFTDESLGDEVSNQTLLRQPDARGVLLCDHRVRTVHAAAAPYPHGQVVDRIAAAEAAGGRVVRASTREELVGAVAGWGIPAAGLRETVDAAAPTYLCEAPFYAVEAQPAITFTFGGLAVDVDGRVLRRDGTPVPGLWGAGADAGGLQERRYVGGLVLGLVFGPRAADAALRSRGAAR
jgi:predicted oxidoreductase